MDRELGRMEATVGPTRQVPLVPGRGLQDLSGAADDRKQRMEIMVVKKGVATLAIVLVGTAFFALCLVSAIQLLEPRDMPFGVTGSSPVVKAVQHKDPDALDLKTYSSEADLIKAAERGDIYGGYIRGRSADTLVTVPAKSFFGEIYVRGAFGAAAKISRRPMTTTKVAPLPTSDRTGAVAGLLLLPTLIGGYLIATLLFTVTQSASAPGRIAIILGFSVAVALITGAAALAFGAVPTSHIWALLPCFALVTASVALAGSAIQRFLGKIGTLLMAVLFVVIGGASAGGTGVSLLPSYWQTIGAVLPATPRRGALPQRALLRRSQHRAVHRGARCLCTDRSRRHRRRAATRQD